MTSMRSLLMIAILTIFSGIDVLAQQTFYIAPDGDDSNPGTFDEPFATLPDAQVPMAPGDTLYMLGGTYEWNERSDMFINGEDGAPIHLFAYPGDEVIVDYTGTPIGTSSGRGMSITGDYWYLKGFTVENAGDNGIHISGNHNTVELVIVRYNGDSGLQMDNQAANNLILNVDSYENYDAHNNGENADGFAAKFDLGPGNVFRGCRAFRNSDDGFDMWNRDTGLGYGVRVEDSWTFENGINRWGDPDFQGDGNGYKLGQGTGPHELVRVLAWDHPAHGVDVNGNETGVTVLNSSAFRNDGRNFYFDEINSAHVLRNNISHAGDVRMDAVDDAFNSWNDGFSTSDGDFLNLDPTGLDGPRQADGSLPETDFLHLVQTSPLVNAGTDVGLPFAGAAPDLGAFETDVGVNTRPVGELPQRVTMAPAYPNPFRSGTTLTLETPAAGHVTVTIIDALGRTVATLADAPMEAGEHRFRWETRGVHPAGLYLAVVQTPNGRATRSLTLIK